MNIYEEAKCIRKNKANYHGTQSHIPLVLNRGFDARSEGAPYEKSPKRK